MIRVNLILLVIPPPMNKIEILEKLETFTEDAIRKIYESGLSYLVNTKVTDQGLKIGCVLIMDKKNHYDLYDLTKRNYIQENLISKKISIAAAIGYNRCEQINKLINMDTELQSLLFEEKHFKQLYKNAFKNNNAFKITLYETLLETTEFRLFHHLNNIQIQFQNCNLDK